jgi:hypothetical protein
MAPTVNQKVSSMQFDAYDRNPNSGQDVCCAIIVQNMGGDALATMTLCTAGSKAGLYTPAANLPSPVFGQIANYRCSIPPQTTTGLSFLTSYVVAY